MSKIKPINRERRAVKRAEKRLRGVLRGFFSKEKTKITRQVVKAYSELTKEVARYLDPRVQQILDQIDTSGFTALVGDVDEILAALTRNGITVALLQIGLKEEDITEIMNGKALEYAKDRAAEMVGKKWVDGELIDNPNPSWAISESTREYLRSDISQAIEEGWSTKDLAGALEDNFAFSESRANMIARTECAKADITGNMITYRESGRVWGKEWLLSSGHPEADDCEDNADQGPISLDEAFSTGSDAPPNHPNCLCSVVPVLNEPDQEGEEA